MTYIKTSTENPLGWRPFNSRVPNAPAGMVPGFTLTPPYAPEFNSGAASPAAGNSTLKGYYRADYPVPVAGNIYSGPTDNVLFGAAQVPGFEGSLGHLADYFPNYPRLVPTEIQTRDDIFSPVPRVYLPPEEIPVPQLAGLGVEHSRIGPVIHNPAGGTWERIAARRRFSGGVHVATPAGPKGIFFPATPAVPRQHQITDAAMVYSPNPSAPTGFYYPRRPRRIPIPASLRVQNKNWDEFSFSPALTAPGLGYLGASWVAAPVHATPAPMRPPVTPTPRPSPRPVGGPAPVVPIVTSPVVTGPTYPEGVMPVGGGMCQVTSTPETGGVVSYEPCNTVPGVSAGSIAYPPSSPNWLSVLFGGRAVTGIMRPGTSVGTGAVSAYTQALANAQAGILPSLTGLTAQQQAAVMNAYNAAAGTGGSTAYVDALAAAQNGTLTAAMLQGLSPQQQEAIMSAYQSSSAAQQAQLTAGGGGGGGSPTGGAQGAGGAAPSGDYQSVLDWLSQETLINGVPNWVIAAGGALAGIWLMNRGKK
jgi:hypothetical protein